MFTLAVTLLWGTSSWAQKTYEIGTAEELAAFAEAVRPPNPAATTAPAPIFKNFLLSIYYRINAIH